MPTYSFTVKFTGPAIAKNIAGENNEAVNKSFVGLQLNLQNLLRELFHNVENTKYVEIKVHQSDFAKFEVTVSQDRSLLVWLQSFFSKNTNTIESALQTFNFIPGGKPIDGVKNFITKTELVSNKAAKYAKEIFKLIDYKDNFNSIIFHQGPHITFFASSEET